MFKNIEAVIWDWNGTLLNDVWLCVESINYLLKKYNKSQIQIQSYKDLFDFPVKEYYKRIGFDFTEYDFKVVGQEYIDYYNTRWTECQLHSCSRDLIAQFQKNGIRQFVLSAREQSQLDRELKYHNIYNDFETVTGLHNNYAAGKLELGAELFQNIGAPANKVLLIGDTTHDFEVAKRIGCNCTLIANGHHTRQRLQKTGTVVYDSLEFICNDFSMTLYPQVY